jgi:AraC-like DNA-binding protein
VEKSKQLLVRGEKCLAEIAVDVGFYDQSHFAQQFRRHCGITPKKFVAQCGSAKARVVKR